MVYYMIRHKATGEFMPELKKTRGYTHWNPSKFNTAEHLSSKLLGVPRIFSSQRRAQRSIVQWNALPNATIRYGNGEFPWSEDADVSFKSDDRRKEDLEIVMVDIVEIEVITS